MTSTKMRGAMESLYLRLIDVGITVVLIGFGFILGRLTKHVIFKDGVITEAGLPKIDLMEEEPADYIDDAVPEVARIPTIMR